MYCAVRFCPVPCSGVLQCPALCRVVVSGKVMNSFIKLESRDAKLCDALLGRVLFSSVLCSTAMQGSVMSGAVLTSSVMSGAALLGCVR